VRRWTAMSGTVRRSAETAVTERYEALFRVSQTLISIRSSGELFSILARELQAVVNFYVMGVGIYDEKTHEMVTKSYGEPGVPLQAPKFAPEETLSWWVYQHQQPLIIPYLDAETRFPAVAEMLKNRGVRSVCALPLTTVHRRLGGLAVGSLEADAYSTEEVGFLSLVANQVALALDDVLNFDASQQASEALRVSEESLRLIVDTIPGLVNTTTASGEFEFVNRQCLDYCGLTLDELKDWAASNIVHPDDLSRLVTAWQHAVETGDPHDCEYRIRRADGVYRWFHVRSLPWRDTRGHIVRWYTLRTDIDDRKRAEEALRASELSLRAVVDSIPGLVNTMTAEGVNEFVSQQVLDYFGKSHEELKSWATSDAVHPDDLRRVIAAFTSSMETGQPYDTEHRIRRADGVYRWFHVRALPLRDTEGRIIRWYVLSTDIDDRKRVEEALRAATSERTRLSAVRAEIAMALAREDNLRGILHTCAETMVRHLDAAFARIWTLNSDGRVLELQASAGMYTRLDGRYSRIPVGQIKIGLIAQEGKAHLTNDVQNDPRISDSDWARTEKMTSFAGYPLIVEDQIVGVMAMFSRKDLTQSTLDALAFVADGIAQGIERKSAEEALRASELNLRLVVDSIPGLVCTMSAAGEFQLFNRQILEYFGKTPEELKSWAASDLVHADDLPRVIAAFTSSIETGHPYDSEHRCRRADGVYRWFQVRAFPVRDGEGHIVSWYILFTILTSANKQKAGYSCSSMSPIRLSQIWSSATSCGPSPRASGASCSATWWASSCRTRTGTGYKPSCSIFQRAKDLFERSTVRWRDRWVVLSSAPASPGRVIPRT
jgi:PAS domain S-box-containing protein